MEELKMILIHEVKSYLSELDLKAIENGLAQLSVHSLRFRQYLTEEQKVENSRRYDLMTREQWNESCDKNRQLVAQKIEQIIDALAHDFSIYQYKDKNIEYSKQEWDLFFWCNFGDMSYVTLNPNEKRTHDEQMRTINSVLDKVKNIEMDGIHVEIQYNALYNEELIEQMCLEYCKNMEGQFIQCGSMTAKVININGTFYLKKKNSKKNGYYHINNKAILNNLLAG